MSSKLGVHQPFYVVLMFDQSGFHSAEMAPSLGELYVYVGKRTTAKSITAASLPFQGSWAKVDGMTLPNVSVPADWDKSFLPKDGVEE